MLFWAIWEPFLGWAVHGEGGAIPLLPPPPRTPSPLLPSPVVSHPEPFPVALASTFISALEHPEPSWCLSGPFLGNPWALSWRRGAVPTSSHSPFTFFCSTFSGSFWGVFGSSLGLAWASWRGSASPHLLTLLLHAKQHLPARSNVNKASTKETRST